MDADTAALRRWLLNEARDLQQQQEALRARLQAVRSIMRLAKIATVEPAKEASS
jgi:hypothetical protein